MERLAEYLPGVEAKQTLGSQIPSCDSSFKINAYDGVVLDTIDQQSELLFVFLRQQLGPGPTRDLGAHEQKQGHERHGSQQERQHKDHRGLMLSGGGNPRTIPEQSVLLLLHGTEESTYFVG